MNIGGEAIPRLRFCAHGACRAAFTICVSCDRGQRYCGPGARTRRDRSAYLADHLQGGTLRVEHVEAECIRIQRHDSAAKRLFFHLSISKLQHTLAFAGPCTKSFQIDALRESLATPKRSTTVIPRVKVLAVSTST